MIQDRRTASLVGLRAAAILGGRRWSPVEEPFMTSLFQSAHGRQNPE